MATQTSVTERQAMAQIVERATQKWPRHADRIRRAAELVLAGNVERVTDEHYRVRSLTSPTTVYDVRGRVCTCPDNVYNRNVCKHSWAAYAHQMWTIRTALLAERQMFTALERGRLNAWKAAYVASGSEWTINEARRLLFWRWQAARRGETAAREYYAEGDRSW